MTVYKEMTEMTCPFCGKEMKKGVMSGDGRQGLSWKEGENRANFIEKLGGSCAVTAMKGSLLVFTVETHFCRVCKKMIIDTDVTE
jgi:hypothetical protein